MDNAIPKEAVERALLGEYVSNCGPIMCASIWPHVGAFDSSHIGRIGAPTPPCTPTFHLLVITYFRLLSNSPGRIQLSDEVVM